MKMRIALAGELPIDQQLFGKIDLLTGQITGYLSKDGSDVTVQMLVSPSYTGKAWIKWNETHKFPLCTYSMRDDSDDAFECVQSIRRDTALRNIVGESICDKADAIIIVWNEDVSEFAGATWELLRIAYCRKTPCIWISTKSQQTYCLWEYYYKKYTPQYLNVMSEPLQSGNLQPTEINESKGRVLAFWEKRRMNYLKKYKAETMVYPSEEDYLLKADYKMEAENSAGEGIRQVLLDKYEQFNSAAIELNSRFQTTLYQRSVLPFIATIFLAIGFYVETLLGTTISGIIPDIASAATLITGLIAGTGFFIHGCLNLYVYRMSKSTVIYQWQKEFVNDRYVAEIFRVLIHFTPYGVGLNLRKLCDRDSKLYMEIKHLTDDAEPARQNIDSTVVHTVLQHMKEMLKDQIAYHKSSMNRYKAIVYSLEKWGQRIFYVGFGMVLIRSVLQFALSINHLDDFNGMNMNSIVRSFLNMLALILPAWAGYFTTKVQQNNFRYNFNNHENMISRLQMLDEKVEHALEQTELPMEVFDIMVEEFANVILVEDTTGWQQQYMNSSVKPL